MNQKEIRELIEFLVEKDIAEFELERGDMKLHIKRGAALQPALAVAPAVASVPVIPVASVAAGASPSAVAAQHSGTDQSASAAAKARSGPAAEAAEEAGLFIVKSPIVGTFYEAPSPGAPPFFKIGDSVQEGQVLCIIEAMKLMNEIEAEVSGVLAKAFVSNGNPVEYGMPLFGIRKH
jgi:acetyl-CoA carboxylase biotin carboxyl carrier protein